MAISDEQKEEIKARTDIVDLVSSYGHQVEYKGGRPWVKCPFHGEKTASCQLHPVEGFYHCFGCGKSGDVVNFVMEMEGVPFVEALKRLADRAGIEIKETENPIVAKCRRLKTLAYEIASDFHVMLKKSPEAAAAREYLKSRGLDGKVSDDFLIGYVPEDVDKIIGWAKRKKYSIEELCAAGILKASDKGDGKPYSYFGGRLLFTIKNKHGEVVAFSGRLLEEGKKGVGKYVNSPETIIFKKSRTFFAFDKARSAIVKAPNREAIICEGQIDCIRLHISGFPNAVAPLGTSFTEDHASQLKKVADSALLVFDDDAAGHKATIRTASLLLAEDMAVRVVSLPDGDDPDSFIRSKGADAFKKLIGSKAESIVRFQIRAEKQKEEQPDSPNAIVRITKAVAETISKCRSAVMRTALLKEASVILGIRSADIETEINGVAKESSHEEEEARTEEYQSEEKESAQKVRLYEPTGAEYCLVSYLMEDADSATRDEQREALKAMLPPAVLASPMSRKIVVAFTRKPEHEDEDFVRQTVESFQKDEYGQFVEATAEVPALSMLEGANGKKLAPKVKILYLARQIWHDFLVRLIELAKVSWANESDKRKKVAELGAKLKELHSLSPKGVVKFFQTFDAAGAEAAAKPLKPSGQEGQTEGE